MQCEDNGKLRAPLREVCQTADIGCVPVTDGKPDCAPQPDELPIAFDEKTTTLWLFSCKTREWIPFQKFAVCQLNALNLENITNICDVLNIAVNYAGSGECQQGTVTLKELADRILECIQLETKIITIGQGEGNKVKITVDGLPLDPVYVTGRNIWSEGGSGTEADPLVIATHDPICKWPEKTRSQVDASNSKYLGACVDGQPARVPFPQKVCEFPERNQAQVDATDDKSLIACLDGKGVKVPFPKTPCEYPQRTESQVAAARDKNLIACVDGESVKVPYPEFQPPVCESDQITLEEASNAGTDLTLLGCHNNTTVRIPVFGSGFFDKDYICVPTVTVPPIVPPLPGTGPLRVGCNGELYTWLCDEQVWKEIRFNPDGLNSLNPDNVSDICNNFRMLGWYSNTAGDPCVEQVKFTLSQLIDMIAECPSSNCHDIFEQSVYKCVGRIQNQRGLNFPTVNLVESFPSNPDVYMAVYSSNRFAFITGSGTVEPDIQMGEEVGEREIVLVNSDSPCGKLYEIEVYSAVNKSTRLINENEPRYSVSCIAGISTKKGANLIGDIFEDGQSHLNYTTAAATLDNKMFGNNSYHISNGVADILTYTITAKAVQNRTFFVPYGETLSVYLSFWMMFVSGEQRLERVNYNGYATAVVRGFRNLKF